MIDVRLLESPPGTPLSQTREPDHQARAAFGPGRRYWTLDGLALIGEGEVLLVMPEDGELPARVVVAAPVCGVTVVQKPWWSFGAGLYLDTGDARYTVEPEPFYPGVATPGKVRRARAAVRAFETALDAAKRTAD